MNEFSITGMFTKKELDELLSTEYNESIRIVLSRLNKNEADMLRNADFLAMRIVDDKIIFTYCYNKGDNVMSNEETIWNFLMSKIGNAYGVAGLMGNLYAESRLDPGLLQSSYARKFGMTSAEYVQKVDNGTYTNFVHDSAGFGLAQWTYWSRKESFLNFMKSRNVSIADLNMQLVFLDDEIRKYKTVFNTLLTAKSVKEASDIVMARYEKNANQSEANKQKRAELGQVYYDKYYKKADPSPTPSPAPTPEPTPVTPTRTCVETTDVSVNIRYGNGKEFGIIKQVPKKGTRFNYVATSDNGWNAVVVGNVVGWIMGEFSKVIKV